MSREASPQRRRHFAEQNDAQAVCGAAALVEDGQVVRIYDSEADKRMTSPRTALIGRCIPNARFSRRSAMAAIGAFAIEYRYVADRDWLTRWQEAGLVTAAIPQRVYRYRQHAGSLTFDPGGPHTSAIRADLLALAQKWRSSTTASHETRRIAALLDGRCRAMLALEALQRADLGNTARLLFSNGERPSVAPNGRVIGASIDRLVTGA
jgi:hypothetical protein